MFAIDHTLLLTYQSQPAQEKVQESALWQKTWRMFKESCFAIKSKKAAARCSVARYSEGSGLEKEGVLH